ncbi:MAG: thioredoxin family protein, partial [Bacteroidota bacterium]
ADDSKPATKGIYFANVSYQKALNQAATENKPIFIDFYTTWCAPCKWMDQDVFQEQSVGEFFNDSFISLKIDAEKGEGPSLAQEFNVYGYPTGVFLNSEGEVQETIVGLTSASNFMSIGKRVKANN